MKRLLLTAFLTLCFTNFTRAEERDPYISERKKMVEQQIRSRGVTDSRILNAMLKVKRHLFVPEDLQAWAYMDHPLSIGYNQTISQPYIVAYMTELLQLQGHESVLEIGTGSGYQAAVLAELVSKVYSVEIVQPLAEEARKRLDSLGYHNVEVRYGDGYQGWSEHAPFDAIIVTAAPESIPEKLIEQLKVGGRLVIPVGALFQNLYIVTKKEDGIVKKNMLPVRFVPMIKGKK